ncbi:hypothetical protein CRV24_004836 [Beauveria bassiana]|nr:hypothetical protein CRV24_004836 [Beauveria bassiana]
MQFSAAIVTLALATGVFAGVADVNSPATIYQGTCSTITQKCNFKRNGKNAKTTCSSGHQVRHHFLHTQRGCEIKDLTETIIVHH